MHHSKNIQSKLLFQKAMCLAACFLSWLGCKTNKLAFLIKISHHFTFRFNRFHGTCFVMIASDWANELKLWHFLSSLSTQIWRLIVVDSDFIELLPLPTSDDDKKEKCWLIQYPQWLVFVLCFRNFLFKQKKVVFRCKNQFF